MELDKARALAADMEERVKSLNQMLTPDPDNLISTPGALDAALSTAVPGDILRLSNSLVYPYQLKVTRPGISLIGESPVSGQMTSDAPAPVFTAGVDVPASGVSLVGLSVTDINTTGDVVMVTGEHCMLNRCHIFRNPGTGKWNKRGIAANGAFMVISGCRVEDFQGPYPSPSGADFQAILIWNTPGPVTVINNYLEGSSETLMVGGADPDNESMLPSDIYVMFNKITKNQAWQGQQVSCKNAVEFKNVRRASLVGNEISYSWGGHGQDGYLLMLTVRNQSGSAPYSTIEDLMISRNVFSHGAAAINVLGRDNNKPSQVLSRVRISNNIFDDLDPVRFTGSNRMILIGGGPQDLTIDGNKFRGTGIGSQVYFTSTTPKCARLKITNNEWPKSKYGVFGSGMTIGKAWDACVDSDSVLAGNVEV